MTEVMSRFGQSETEMMNMTTAKLANFEETERLVCPLEVPETPQLL